METQRIYQASAADWQNSLRVADRMGKGAIAGASGLPAGIDAAVKVGFVAGVLALLMGILA